MLEQNWMYAFSKRMQVLRNCGSHAQVDVRGASILQLEIASHKFNLNPIIGPVNGHLNPHIGTMILGLKLTPLNLNVKPFAMLLPSLHALEKAWAANLCLVLFVLGLTLHVNAREQIFVATNGTPLGDSFKKYG